MKHHFETWVETSHISVDSKHLLNNSIICYKAGSYTAALLLGYLGFLIILKDRVMRGSKPALYPQAVWDKMLKLLQNEDRWEETIFSAVMQQEKLDAAKVRTMDPVFVINDNLRTQIRYWKDRRNDCAHHKDNRIVMGHVEAFWTFLQSNLQKITLAGGRATLVNKLARHYDTRYTPAGTDVLPILREIKESIEKIEMDSFWDEAFEAVESIFDYSDEIDFIDGVLRLKDDEIGESLINYLQKNEKILMAYINERPAVLASLGYDAQEMRNFWNTKLAPMQNAMGVYASMLRNNLIPSGEIASANRLLGNLYKYVDNIEDHLILQHHGFGEVIYHNLFVAKNAEDYQYWKFMNKHSEFYTTYVSYYPLKDEVVTILSTELAKTNWNPQFLQNSINHLFKNHGEKKKEFKDKAIALGLTLPAPITELAS